MNISPVFDTMVAEGSLLDTGSPTRAASLIKFARGHRMTNPKFATWAVACSSAALLAAGGCSKQPIRIEGLKQGLVRSDKSGQPEVYEQTSTIKLLPNGECVANTVTQQCTWFGIEFDYSGAKAGASLDCTARLSEPSQVVTPSRGSARQATAIQYKIALPTVHGHVRHASYAVNSADSAKQQIAVSCTYDEKPVLYYAFSLEPVNANGA
ncbi:MAG: hypothetical protein ABIT36_04455 [Steroidobacteraceae bacterium]